MGFAIRTISFAISLRVSAQQPRAIGNGPIKNMSCGEKITVLQCVDGNCLTLSTNNISSIDPASQMI